MIIEPGNCIGMKSKDDMFSSSLNSTSNTNRACYRTEKS